MLLRKLCQNVVLTSAASLSLVLLGTTLHAELASSGTLAPNDYKNGVLAFEDNFFSGQSLNTNVWEVTNNSTRSSANATAQGGYLRLKTTETSPGNYKTAEVGTRDFWRRFGYWEAKIRIGAEQGLNNAFWLNTPNPELITPRDRLEIDIQELHNHPDSGGNSNDQLNMHVHDWAPSYSSTGPASVDQDSLQLDQTFHNYALEWKTTNELVWYFDGVQVGKVNSWVVDGYRNFIPLQTLFSTLVTSFAGPPSANLDGTEMTIDWVRTYQKDGWVGNGSTSTNWASSSNWGPDGVPNSQEAAVFNASTTSTTINLQSSARTVKELYFAGDVSGLTFTNTNHLGEFRVGDNNGQLYGGAITLNNDVENTQNINVHVRAVAPLTLANYTPAADGVDLKLNRRLYNDGHDVTIEGTGDIRIAWALKGSGSLTKWGEGMLTLASTASDYSGGTFVNEGTLRADGNLTGTADVIVTRGSGSSSSTLEGDGSIAGKVIVSNFARLSPGNAGIGTLTVNNDVQMNSNGRLAIEVSNTASDLLIVDDLNLSNSQDRLQLDFIGNGSYQNEYTIVQYSGSLTGTFNTIEGLSQPYVIDYGSGSNSSIKLIFSGASAVPEPSTACLVYCSCLCTIMRSRRRCN